ncbi:SO_0444 family Cu/Zn efflux transporter [candidate division GN15 bacterium]|nr:SO_0444 family Cu/Zn efflux transporter [candidate division GN15 bacterium]
MVRTGAGTRSQSGHGRPGPRTDSVTVNAAILPFLERWALGVWGMVVDSAVWFLIGLILAGLLWHFFRGDTVARLLSGRSQRGVWRAALIGLPLPLCSCSVLPVAQQLRSSGASKGSLAAFLISTPETGVDSIALTYTLTDPVLTVARPVTAFATALAAGGAETFFPDKQAAPVPMSTEPCCDSDNCCADQQTGNRSTVIGSIKYAFTDLLGDLAPYLLIGFVLAGLVAALFGGELTDLPEVLRQGWGGYLGAILAGLPLYICASSSTPLAAVLLAGGFSPGMVLVFMMVGAATNVSTITVVNKIMGAPATVRYLTAIVIVSVAAGLLTDQVYGWLELVPTYTAGQAHAGAAWYDVAAGAMLGLLIVYWTAYDLRKRLRRFFLKKH